ncbi:MAG: SAVED domain-containing protein [Gammaproteobacteria bacterium]|nr:SAVED domain-containing protein [Gammaproteobacteria bacterium]
MGEDRLEDLMADRAPLYYRSPQKIAEMLRDGHFKSAFVETVARLPISEHFRNSHFGEILSGVFAQEVLGWRLLYSKLRLNTAENSNPHKMDLLFLDPDGSVPTLILGEVKSSMKSGVPAGHDVSCYPSLFDSLREYSELDLQYDLTAARDHLDDLPLDERRLARQALLPYSGSPIMYAGFVVVDTDTRSDSETSMLATRKSEKQFDIDLVCVENLAEVCAATYGLLKAMRDV